MMANRFAAVPPHRASNVRHQAEARRGAGGYVVVALVAVCALALSSCGDSNDDTADSKVGATVPRVTIPDTPDLDTPDLDTPDSDTPDSGGSSGSVDCEAVNAAQAELLQVQLLAQFRDPESIETLKSRLVGNLDLGKFHASMTTLHALDGFSSPLGDPKAAIDIYEQAATDAQALIDADPPTQAAIDEYNASIGDTGTFLQHQVAIAGGLDAAGC